MAELKLGKEKTGILLFRNNYIYSTVRKALGSVMLWGCVFTGGVGNLHFINGIGDHYVYINIFIGDLRGSVQ